MTTIRVGHLYPDYLNIYADRGNIAVLTRRAAWRGHELEVTPLGMGDAIAPGEHDLYYVGGGQDREQLLVAEDLLRKSEALHEAVDRGAAALAVCGGYQLLGRGYRGFHGEDLPGIGLLPLETVAGERRLIGDVLIECELEPGEKQTFAGFENHAGRTRLDAGAEPLGRVLATSCAFPTRSWCRCPTGSKDARTRCPPPGRVPAGANPPSRPARS